MNNIRNLAAVCILLCSLSSCTSPLEIGERSDASQDAAIVVPDARVSDSAISDDARASDGTGLDGAAVVDSAQDNGTFRDNAIIDSATFGDSGAPRDGATYDALMDLPPSRYGPPQRVSMRRGSAVALSSDGNTLAVAGEGSTCCNISSGVAVFYRRGNVWDAGRRIVPPAGAEHFGEGLALADDGNTLLVGDYDQRTATLYVRSGDDWNMAAQLEPPSGQRAYGNIFGYQVALSADGATAAVGNSMYQSNGTSIGAVSVYTRTAAGTWSASVQLVPPANSYSMGTALSLSDDGNTLAVGDWAGGADHAGQVGIFTRSNGVWSEAEMLRSPRVVGAFGGNISISGDGMTVLVGESSGRYNFPSMTITYPGTGSATVYRRINNTWSDGTQLMPPDGVGDFGQGLSLSYDGNTAVVGDPRNARRYGLPSETPLPRGVTLVYSRRGDTWTQNGYLSLPAGAHAFGGAISVSGDGTTIAVGDSYGGDSGATHVYGR